MSLKTVFSMLALTVVGSLSVAACAAPTDEATDPQGAPAAESQDEELRLASYNSCNADSDCVATPKPACCPNGINVAVNKTKVASFDAANACKTPPQACPMFVILDTRVAECNIGTKKCEMIKPEDVRCGGFIKNAHKCATGYSCDHTGINPDAAGKCVKDAASDCRSSGCASGKKCSACWGAFTCIPNGAMC